MILSRIHATTRRCKEEVETVCVCVCFTTWQRAAKKKAQGREPGLTAPGVERRRRRRRQRAVLVRV